MHRPTIGILAGMGPRSTAPFLELVLGECEEQYSAKDDIDFPKMMICSLPVPFYPDRPTDHVAMEAAIRRGLQDLAGAGVDFLAIPCNTAHVYYQSLSTSVDLPLLNMVELALATIPPAPRAVALVAARPTVEAGIYQRGIRERGNRFVALDWQQEVDTLIGATRGERNGDIFRSAWSNLVGMAEREGADTLLVGCMDLSAIKVYLATDMAVIDAGQCLACEIVRQWQSLPAGLSDESEQRVDIMQRRGSYRVTSRRRDMDVEAISAYLTRSYWAEGISREVVARAIRNSLCFGLFFDEQQVGFARVITDHATYAYLCDVYVLEEHQKRGFGKWLVETATSYPTLQNVRRFMLATKDAHELYTNYGFAPLATPARFMECERPDAYRTPRPTDH